MDLATHDDDDDDDEEDRDGFFLSGTLLIFLALAAIGGQGMIYVLYLGS
jgi:hypothetical protein